MSASGSKPPVEFHFGALTNKAAPFINKGRPLNSLLRYEKTLALAYLTTSDLKKRSLTSVDFLAVFSI